jgi:N-lysine methyltransferase SETD6
MFVFEASEPEIPDPLISFTKLMQQPPQDWEKTRSKGKPPKAKLDNAETVQILLKVLEMRMGIYPTTLEVRVIFQIYSID